ncbi:MAG: serine/threonine-protein kinase [Cyanobacteria bacterium J06621_8]
MNQRSPSKNIAGYQIEQKIGQGSFALVYAAKNTHDIRQPKRALLELILEGDRAERKLRRRTFMRTAEILEKLNHPSIPRIYSLFEQEDTLYLEQEFIDGINYSSYLDDTNAPLTITELEKVFWEVLEGLAQLHQAKIVHRDIKPSNLMRRQPDGSTVIVDFGSACDLSTLNALETTIGDQGEALGYTRIYTPGYAHPEQRDGMATATAQWDLYALAKTIVALRIGQNPPWNQPVSIDSLGFSTQVSSLLQEMLKTEGCQLIDAWDAIKFEAAETESKIAAAGLAPVKKRTRKSKGWVIWGVLATAALAAGSYWFLPQYTRPLVERVTARFFPKCPNYVQNELEPPVPDRGFAARFYYPETAQQGDATLEVLQEGNLIARGQDSSLKGFIWLKSLTGGNDFPPGNYQLRLLVPESLPYEQEVTLDADFPVYYLGNAAAVQVTCALNSGS